jgi:hypothetical protein
MTEALFGKTITREFIPDDGFESIVTHSQVPAIYLFSVLPSYDQAISGTGASQSVNYWTHSGVTASRGYSYAPVVDPSSASAITYYDYFEAINYKLEAAGTTQTKIRSFPIKRAEALDSKPNATITDIKYLWPEIVAYITDTDLDRYLTVAEELIRANFEGSGNKWTSLRQLNRIKYAIAFKAIIMFSAVQLTKPNGDKFASRIEYFAKELDSLLSSVKLPIDADRDGIAESISTTGSSYAVINR